jgi:acyl-CoA thioesterase I
MRGSVFLAGAILVAATPGAESADPAQGQKRTVAFLGDSLTAGTGLTRELAYPALVEAELGAEGLAVQAVNAGVSGDTTGQGLARLDGVLESHPEVVVVALGTNDALRGLPPEAMEANLETILSRCQARGARVLLLGMRFATWLAPEVAARYEAIYPRVAARAGVALLPSMLEGVAGVPAFTQPDGLHPNASGQRRVAELVCPELAKLLRQGQGKQ